MVGRWRFFFLFFWGVHWKGYSRWRGEWQYFPCKDAMFSRRYQLYLPGSRLYMPIWVNRKPRRNQGFSWVFPSQSNCVSWLLGNSLEMAGFSDHPRINRCKNGCPKHVILRWFAVASETSTTVHDYYVDY